MSPTMNTAAGTSDLRIQRNPGCIEKGQEGNSLQKASHAAVAVEGRASGLGGLERLVHLAERGVDPLCRSFGAWGAVLAGIMSVPIFFDVVSRMLTGTSIPGVIESQEFTLVAVVFLGLAHIQLRRDHINIDLLVVRLPAWGREVVESFNDYVCLVLFSLMSWQTVVQVMVKRGEVSFSLGLPLSLFLGISAAGTILLALVILVNLLRSISNVMTAGKAPWLALAFACGTLVLVTPFLLRWVGWRPGGAALGGLGMGFLMLLLLARMPIGFAMAVAGFLGMCVLSPNIRAPLSLLGITPYSTTASFLLAVVPLFILMGELAFHSGLSEDLFDAAHKWLGRFPGGLAMAAVAGCAGFAAVCGDSMSTAVTMGTVSLPEMKKKGYRPSIATGSLAAGGTLGILIPPSVGFIFYAIITEESIGKLFVAGILPGVLLATLFILCILIQCKMDPAIAIRGERTGFKEKLSSLKGVFPMIGLFILILGGILGGVFSPTEGGGIGAVGAFLYALARRRISRRKLMQAFEETARLTTKLLMILIGVSILGYFLAATRLPFALAEIVTSLSLGRNMIFFAVILLYIVLGCLMNVIPMILLTLPAIFPSIVALGFDPIWFGVITVIVMEMGQITPPIGVNVFAISSIAGGVSMATIFKGILPFFLCMVICVIILLIFPQIALVLPRLLL